MQPSSSSTASVAIVGGGLAGLSAACYAARSGARVQLLESSSELGGRARTRRDGAYTFNMGPHALYRRSIGQRVLRELGVRTNGVTPDLSEPNACCGGRLHRLPVGPVSMVTTTLLNAGDKLACGQFLAGLPKLDTTAWQTRTLDEFLDAHAPRPGVRAVLNAYVRLATYTHASDRVSAGFALDQLKLALDGGVEYLHGGWSSLIESLSECAAQEGVDIRRDARVRALVPAGPDRSQVELLLRNGERIEADVAILATSPAEAMRLLPSEAGELLRQTPGLETPVRAACLEIGLRELPRSSATFALGIDRPTYASLHSQASGLAPQGGANFQLARYLKPGESMDRSEVQLELENLLELLQPGWRPLREVERLLVDVPVSHLLPLAEAGGLSGRPAVDELAKACPRVLLAGDWVGSEGWLADGSLASGQRAGELAAERTRESHTRGRQLAHG